MIPVYCTTCGQLIKEGGLFCPNCGTLFGRTVEKDQIECENHSGETAIGVCVVCGKPVCGDCAVSVQKIIYCDQPEHQTMTKEWALIHSSDCEFDADAVQRNLEFAGIQTKAFSMRDHLESFWFDEFAIVHLMVRQSEAEKAIAVLKELQLLNDRADKPSTRNT